jgi:DNA gyrase subunit B
VVTEAFNEFSEVNPREARKIIDKCMTSKRAREAARKARDLVRSGPSLLRVPPCPASWRIVLAMTKTRSCTLWKGILQGEQLNKGATVTSKPSLPLRGKILNTERARLHKILDNDEVKSLVTALGTGIGDDFDIKRLRYGRVIVMTDADVDGSHIRTLLTHLLLPPHVATHHRGASDTLRNRPSFNFPAGSKWSTSTTKLASTSKT